MFRLCNWFMTWLLCKDTLDCHPLFTFVINIATRSRYNSHLILRPLVVLPPWSQHGPTRKATIILLYAVFYKTTEKNWRGMFFISWPLKATNACHRILGFVLLWCLAEEGTCLSLFSSGTAGNIFYLHTYTAVLVRCKCSSIKLYSHSNLREWKYQLSRIYLDYNFYLLVD